MGPVQSCVVNLAHTIYVGRTKQQDGSVIKAVRGKAVGIPRGRLGEVAEDKVRVVCMADPHEHYEKVVVPGCDLLIVAGDLLLLNRWHTEAEGIRKVKRLGAWLESQPARDILVIPGNHDLVFERLGPVEIKKLLPGKVTYCTDDPVELQGLKIYASAWSSGKSTNKAFQAAASTDPLAAVPEGLDILVTHQPAASCTYLQEVLQRTKPILHVGGHHHWSYGIETLGATTCICASTMDSAYKPTNPPIVVDLLRTRQEVVEG